MRKIIKIYVFLVFIILILLSIMYACSNKTSKQAELSLIVDQTAIKSMSGEEITLPFATAIGKNGEDLSDNVKLNVFYEEENEFVYPISTPKRGASAKKITKIKLTKVGSYKVNYFIVDDERNILLSKDLSLIIESNNSPLIQNAISNINDWEMGGNCFVNDEDYLVLGMPKDGEQILNMSSLSYKKQQIRNGDRITFIWNTNTALVKNGLTYIDVSMLLTSGSLLEKPNADEGINNPYLKLRVGNNRIDMKWIDAFGKDLRGIQDNIQLIDGIDHRISIKIETKSNELIFSLWVDKNEEIESPMQVKISKEKFENDMQGISYNSNLFSENTNGWFSIGCWRGDTSVANDCVLIKGFTVNGEANLNEPIIKVDESNLIYIKDNEIVFPKAKANDKNTNEIITNLTTIVQSPDGKRTELPSTLKYTPVSAGEYVLIYKAIDRSGNISVLKKIFNVIQSQTKNPPLLEFDKDTHSNYSVEVNQIFKLPFPSKITDEFNNDLSKRLSVKLLGKEVEDISNKKEYKFYTPGTHTISYSLLGLNDVCTEKLINVEVKKPNGLGNGNLINSNYMYYFGNVSNVNDNIVGNEGAFAYTGYKIYDEKVSYLINLSFCTNMEKEDGTFLYFFNVRGGEWQEKPQGDIRWPNSLFIALDYRVGVQVFPNGYNSVPYVGKMVESEKSMREIFHGKDVVFEYKATDIIENNEIVAVKLEIWINGKKIEFSNRGVTKDGDLYLNKRYISDNPNLLKSAWLITTMVGSDKVNSTNNIFKEIYIDNTKLGIIQDNINGEVRAVDLNSNYSIIEPSFKFYDSDISNLVKILLYKFKSTKPSLESNGLSDYNLHIDSSFIGGFEIWYVYESRIIKKIHIDVNVEVSKISWNKNTENINISTLEEFELPYVESVFINDVEYKDNFNYIATLQNKNYSFVLSENLYTFPIEGQIKVDAMYGTILLDNYIINVNGINGNLVERDDWKGNCFLGQLIYNNTVSSVLNFNGELSSYVKISLCGSKNKEEITNYNWPKNIGLQFDSYGNLYVAKGEVASPTAIAGGARISDYLSNFPKFNNEKFLLQYKVDDMFENGSFVGIKIIIYIDGVRIIFKDNCVDKEGNCYIPAEQCEEWFFTPNAFACFSNCISVKILQLYYDGTPAFIFKSLEAKKEYNVGDYFEIPKYSIILSNNNIIYNSNLNFIIEDKIIDDQYVFDKVGNISISIKIDDIIIDGFVVKVSDPNSSQTLVTNVQGISNQEININIGENFNYKKITYAKVNGVEINCNDLIYYINYQDKKYNYQLKESTTTFKVSGKATITAYLGEIVIGSYCINILGEDDDLTKKNNWDDLFVLGDGQYYKGQYIYLNNVKAVLNFSSEIQGYVRISLRGTYPQMSIEGYNWPKNIGLQLDLYGNIYICKDDVPNPTLLAGGAKISDYILDFNNKNVLFEILSEDVYENNIFIGIRFVVKINGTRLELKDGLVDDEGNCFIPLEECEEWYFTPTIFGFFRNDNRFDISIKELYIK